jgi:type II secretory pathway pseudopilin PulG
MIKRQSNIAFGFSRIRARLRAVTMLELIVAMLLALAILGSVVTTFVHLLRTARDSETRIDAVSTARAAMDTLSNDIKAASNSWGYAYFQGFDGSLTYGDGFDDDDDGAVDEEIRNGLDDDGDWSESTHNDVHAVVGSRVERPRGRGRADLGDLFVDEDCVFDQDVLEFRIPGTQPGVLYETIRYDIRYYDEISHVLVREVETMHAGGGVTVESAPLAFEVLSFNCLYWDSNASANGQYWKLTWNSAWVSGSFATPAAVAVTLTVGADPKGFDTYTEGGKIETFTLQTEVNIESVIQDGDFRRLP